MLAIGHLGCVFLLASADAVEGDEDFPVLVGLPHITKDFGLKLRSLPKFSSVQLWVKGITQILTDFPFMKLLVYLVCGRDETYDIKAMKAFKSLNFESVLHFRSLLHEQCLAA